MSFNNKDHVTIEGLAGHGEMHSVAEQLLCLAGVADLAGETDIYESVHALCAQLLGTADGAVLVSTATEGSRVGFATSADISGLLHAECALNHRILKDGLAGVGPVHDGLDPADVPYDGFVERALNMGFHHECVLPLRHRETCLGAVVILGRNEIGPSHDRVTLAGMLTSVAAAVLHAAHTSREALVLANQLQTALDSRVTIEQAKGVLAIRDGMSLSAAFAILRNQARAERRSVADVATDVVRSL